jgi:hypothetical protein
MLGFAILDDAYKIPSKEVSKERDEVNKLHRIVNEYENQVPEIKSFPLQRGPQINYNSSWNGMPVHPNSPLAPSPQPATKQIPKRDANKEALELIDKLMDNPVVLSYITQRVKMMDSRPSSNTKPSLKETFIATYNNTIGCTDIKGYLTIFLLIVTIYLGVSLILDYMKSTKTSSISPGLANSSSVPFAQQYGTRNLF